MSDSTINASRATPSRAMKPQPLGQGLGAHPRDVAELNDAFAVARERQQQALLRQGARFQPRPEGGPVPREPSVAQWRDMLSREREAGGPLPSSGLGVAQPGAAPVPLQSPAMPSPTVDPSAFAQLMTELWSREHGKGAKEVRVEFGADAWPATGARLVRNAAGALDVELHLGEAATPGQAALDRLRERFGDEGVALGALTTSVQPLA